MEDVINCSDRYRSCIDACNRCFEACRECSVLCLETPDAAGRKDSIDMLMKFAGICQEASCSMSTETKPVNEIIALCTNLSDECKKCADVCRTI